MRRLALALGMVVSVGCHASPVAPLHRPVVPQLAVTARTPTDPDVSALPRPDSHVAPARPTQYHRLTAAECRTLAVRNAPLADELDAHPDNTPAKHLSHKDGGSDLSRLVRGYAADEIRNRSAADALDLYYKLAAAEGQFDLAAKAHAELREQLAAAEKAVAGGLKGIDVGAIRRQVLETESHLAKLVAGIAALNAGLAGRLGLDPADPTPVWPADVLRVGGDEVDVEQAVATGLRCRPDLNLLRVLAAGDDRGGRLANAVLNGVNPLLGGTDPANPLVAAAAFLKKHPTQSEEAARRQLQGLLATRERQADAEIRAAVATLRGNRLSAVAKAAEVRNLTERVTEAEKRVAAGVAGAAAELSAAKLELLKAKADLVQAAADWQVAEVKLRQATGMLVRE